MSRAVSSSVALFALCLFGCGDRNSAGTTGVETTNGFSLLVQDSSGRPVAGARVVARPSTWTMGNSLPLDSTALQGLTDSIGRVKFQRFPSADWTFEARHACLAGMLRSSTVDTEFLITLAKPGSVSGIANAGARMTVAGLVHGTTAGPNGAFLLDSLPAGILASVDYSVTNSANSTVFRFAVPVQSGDTTVIFNPAWKYARPIYFNTSTTGASVAGNVLNIPVLIRLNTTNFDFSQAEVGGGDLRFTKMDNSPLSFKIERYDPVSGIAAVWVKVDTILGNDTSQFINMYWGDPTAATDLSQNLATSVSRDTAVFQTSNGFQGVWHLSEGVGSMNDATANHFNGSRNGNQHLISGEIGYGQSFLSTKDFSDMGNVLNPGNSNLSVSAWIKRNIMNNTTNTIIGKSNGGPPSNTYGWLMTMTNGHLYFNYTSGGVVLGDSGTFSLEAKTAIMDTTTWHHVAAVIDRSSNSKCILYVDGVNVTDSIFGDVTKVGAITNPVNFRIGLQANGSNSAGAYIDEAIVSYVPRSANWVKISYMNQQAQDKLTAFK